MRVQLPLALLLASTTAACVDDTTDISSALELENGGFDTEDEAPMFGSDDRFAAAALEADRPVADAMRDSAELRALAAAPGAASIDVVVMWGHFRADPDAPAGHDWTGSLELSRGGMAVQRAIGFEDEQDRVLPRVQRDLVAFESRTQPRTDGLALRIIDPTPAAPSLQIKYSPANEPTAGYTLDLGNLDAGPVVHDFPDGTQLVVIARRHRDDCGTGFVRGRWHAISPTTSTFLGAVTNADGEIVGHMRGIAGMRQNGDQVFFGKWVNREGQFRGVFRGAFTGGQLRAKLADRGGEEGVFHGAYRAGDSLGHGGFVGRWAETACHETLQP